MSKMNKPLSVLAVSCCLAAVVGAHNAGATLGERVESVAKDRKALSAVRRSTTTGPNYTVHESASDATTIREYVNASGIVFAVAWNGFMHPDLTQLLGSYASDYQQAKRQQPRRRGQRRLQVTGDQVVVQTWGHMRSLQGRAYVPSLVPAGVDIHDLK